MRYFKIVLACFGFIFAVVGITAGVLFLTGKFDKEVIQPEDIAFEITEKLTEDDFEVVVNTTTENVTEKDVTLSLTNQTETDGMISDGVITVPKVVKLGTPFTVKVNKTHYAGMTEEWNVGGTSIIRAKSTNPLIQEAAPLTVEVDVPVHSLGVELVTTTGAKIGTVSARDLKNYMRTLAEGDEDKKVVELAVGSVVRLQPVFTPAKSARTTKGEQRKVLFEIPTAWKGIHIDFVDGENDLIEILRQTTVEDIKINAYCFRTSADEYEAQSHGYSDEELITMMNASGISGESAQIFGTNQKITSFTSSTNDEYINLSINSPLTLIANGTGDNAFNLGLGLASDAGVAKLEDKIAVVKLFAYWKNDLGNWEDAGNKLEIIGQTSSAKTNGVKAKINKNDANLSSWRVVASETGNYKIVANLSYEYYSSSSSVPTVINFDINFGNILVSDPISSDVAWKNTLPAIKTLVVLDGETAAEKYYPTINLADYVDIKNPNATYKVVRFFAYSTEGLNLSNVINCSLYSGNFAVPDSSYQYEVFEIPNGILTAKDVGTFRIFFATVVSDYMGNPKIQFGEYLFESFSNTNTINVVKSLKQLDASMTVNPQEDGKDYNKNTDENTRDYVFHVRQQDEKVFTLSLFVSDIEIFKRDYDDGKILIDFLLGGEKSNILTLSDDYVVDEAEKRIDFQVSVNSLPNNDQPTLECKVSYDLDHRLDKFVSNNGKKVQIKVLNGFAQEIVFDAVKDAYPKNSAENPIQVEIKFNAGSDNIATNIEYGITLNGQNLILEDLSKVTINDEALNRNYTLSSNKPAVIAVEDSLEGAKLSILGSTTDEDVVITATAADGSGLSTNLYFRVLASLQIALTPNESEITIDGYQGNQINFRSYFDAKAGEIDLNNLLEYNVPIENADKFVFADDTLKIVSTLGRDASLQLYITSDFGFTKIIPIRVVSNITASSTYAFNDQGLDDADFVARGETPPTERGTRVYAENSREISFVLTQDKPTSTNIAVSVDDFELPKNGGIQNISYSNGILTICFDAVSQMTEKTIVFKKNFSENDEYAFVYTMKFLVFPNIKASLVSSAGSENNPANYISGETVVYDAKNNSNGLIKLERILGSNIISEHATLEAKINGEWVALASNSGAFTLPASFRATEGGYVDIRITYDGYVLTPLSIFFKPFFDESILLDAKVLYGGKLYVPFIASGENAIALTQADGVVYTIIPATSEQYLRIRGNQIEKLDRLYTKIVSTEKLRIENNNGVTELPILILPVKYPFVAYDSIENAESEETYRTVDLKNVVESETIYDTLEAGSEEIIDLKTKILVDGLDEGRALISVLNADGSTNGYVNFDQQNLTISANSVGKDQMVFVKVKCGAEFEEAFEFVYRIKITANQQIKVFYPYVEYNEEYNVENACEYLYFGSKNQISLDLLEEFDANLTPNKNLLEKLFETTNGKTYARRFVVVREKDGVLIPLEHKDLHFEIASVGIGKTVIPAEQVSNYVVINEKSTTDGVLQNVNLLINRGQATETIHITIRAYTLSGAEAYYRLQINNNPNSFIAYYKNKKIESDEFSVASNGQSDINLNESVLVKVEENNTTQTVSPNAYKFYLIVHEKLGTDYSQFIELSGGHIRISTLVNDVETTVVIYNAAGEISRFNLILKCTIDHEVKSTTIGSSGVYDIGESIDFFNTAQSANNYSMKEISTRLYIRDYLNRTEIGTTQENNLFINVGGYSVKDISKNYNQYVMLDNMKVYAENLFNTWGGKFYLKEDAEARYDVLKDSDGQYIRFNNSVIRINSDNKTFSIPLQSTTDEQTVNYEISEDGNYVNIPHLKFLKGNDTRDYVLFDEVVYENALKTSHIEAYGTSREGETIASRTTYVYAYVEGFVRYKVDEIKDSKGKTTELKVSILSVTHNNIQYTALVDENHNDDEYILVGGEKHYFTRFYTIKYDGLAAKSEDGKDNVPKVRYMLENEENIIDLSKIIFYTQEGKSENVLKLDDESYIDGLFTFFVDDGSGEAQVNFVEETDGEGNQKTTWKIELTERFSPITIIVKDTTGKYVVGRLTILPTVETSTDSEKNNKTIFISAGSEDINYQINGVQNIDGKNYFDAMENDFGDVLEKHSGWTKYVYEIQESDYQGARIDKESGNIEKIEGSPWGKITVGAKIRYQSPENKSFTTTIDYATWKTRIFGDNFASYSDLKAQLVKQKIDIKLSETVSDGESVEFDADGNIINVAYGSKITISFVQKCEKCKNEVALGETHECWYDDKTETITELSDFSDDDDQLNTLAGDESVEIVDTTNSTKKYVYVLTAGSTLKYTTDESGENGQWTLDGSITKTTKMKHSFTAKFDYDVPKEGELQLTLDEETKDPDAGEGQPTTYGKKIGETELQSIYSKLGFEDLADFINAIKKTLTVSSGSVSSDENGVQISGATEQSVKLSYSVVLTKSLTQPQSDFEIASLEIDTANATLALFGETATTILGYSDWNALLEDCVVEWDGYGASNTFSGTKIINLTITTKDAKHTGTFYIVNQEYDKSTLHGIGNLSNIGYSLKDYVNYFDENGKQQEKTQAIGSVVYVGTVTEGTGDNATQKPIWVYPMTTNKYLKGGAEYGEIAGFIEEAIGAYKDNLTNNNFRLLEKDRAEENTGSIDSGNYSFGESTPLKTAAELSLKKDPFNTITLYHNKYAIMNIHIYLEDFYGDNTAETWNKYSSENSGTNLEISSGNVTLLFSVDKDNLLTTTLTTTDIDGKEKIEYITQNAVMNNNQYLFENGLLLEWDDKDKEIVLSMVNKESKIEFAFNDVLFEVSENLTSKSIYEGFDVEANKTIINYFEGLKDLVVQPEQSDLEKGEKTYKAEKTGSEEDDSDVIYKDKIEGKDFNFEAWDYSSSYENENGQTMEATGKSITVVNLGDKKQLKITINNIFDIEGNLIEGGYTFVVDLNETSAVNIIGGNEGATSPNEPINGGKIASSQTKTIELNGDVFKVDQTEAKLQIEYAGDKTSGGKASEDELVDALYALHALSYLKGILTFEDTTISSNVFRFKKDGENTTVSIIVEANGISYEYVISRKEAGGFELTASDDSLQNLTKFTLEINKELYEVVGEIEEYSETTDPIPTDAGDSTDEDGTEDATETTDPTRSQKRINITVTPVFTYECRVESNSTAVDSTFDKETGKFIATGKHTSVDKVVKLRFSVLRGSGNSAKEVAYAYYSLTVSPSVKATISYPTISTSNIDEGGKFIKEKQTTEYFYADAGEFDVTAKSNISKGEEATRIAVTRYAYGVDKNGKAARVTYSCDDGKITITTSDSKKYTAEQTDNQYYTSDVGTFYIPSIEVSYIASSSQKIIIEGKDSEGKNVLADKVTAEGGKFGFDMSKVSVSEAEVVISVQATVDGYPYTFGQYILTVCKNPVISTLITTEDGHLDENGAEILPVNGEAEADLTPFVEKIGETPRLQFVYNSLILSPDYNSSFKANGGKISEFTIPQAAIDEEAQSVAFTFDGQKVSGEYRYTRVWDFKMNPNLDSHTIEGNYVDPDAEHKELLNYYYLDAGKTYDIVKTFGITRYFGEKFEEGVEGLAFGTENEDKITGRVELVSGGQGINIKGAPEGGLNFQIKFKPYSNASYIVVGITALPTIEIKVNYQRETIYEGDTEDSVYGLIANETTYTLVDKGRGVDFTIERNGVTADITKGEYTITLDASRTDSSLGAKVEQTNNGATLIIATPPALNAKRVVLKVSDNYGYFRYLKYVVSAKTQVEISNRDITFTTGGQIEWDENNNKFPISFKKENEETIQLSSFYTAEISGATPDNISDTHGDSSSLKVGADDEKLYGVQLDSVVTKTTETDESITKTRYIPYVSGEKISYDVYKLAAKDSDGKDVVLKSFDKYKKQIVEYGGGEWNSTTSGENVIIDSNGAFSPQKNGDGYIEDYKISLYSTTSSETAVATIEFKLLLVQKTDNLYYASRENAADCYTFAYDISIDGTNIVTGTTINNIGNEQYGAAQSLNATLKISVEKADEELDTIEVGILLKFGIYPKVTQQISGLTSFDYVGLGDNVQTVLTNKEKGIELVSDAFDVSGATKSYSKVLGDSTSSAIDGTFGEMKKGTFASDYSYDQTTRILSLKATLSDGTAKINNIKYVYGSDKKTLKIGYRVVPLTDGAFVDDVTGITYKVNSDTTDTTDTTELSISKKVDNANTVTINNKKYTVETSNGTTVKYETLYESIFVVWQYGGNTYWAQWNYKVVDKFNQVTTSDPLEAQDGNIKVKLDWVSGDYRFNPNTLELKNGDKVLGTAKWVSDSSGNDRYEIEIDGTTYTIEIDGTEMKFKAGESYYQNVSADLVLEEETTQNTSWADKIKLTGLDANVTPLRSAGGVSIYVDGTGITDFKITSTDLTGTTHLVQIKYTGIDGKDNTLLFNGNAVKVTFEHFSATA